MIDKPAIGAPCNGCGLCCRVRVCGAGAFAMGLVTRYGERVDGPCPALTAKGDGSFACGIVERPKEYLTAERSVTVLREAMKILIGAGAGCDEAGDETAPAADAALQELQQRYLARHGEAVILRAVRIIHGGKS